MRGAAFFIYSKSVLEKVFYHCVDVKYGHDCDFVRIFCNRLHIFCGYKHLFKAHFNAFGYALFAIAYCAYLARKPDLAEYCGKFIDGLAEVSGGERCADREISRRLAQLYSAHCVDVDIASAEGKSATLFKHGNQKH